VKHQLINSHFLFGYLLATFALGQMCSAQDYPGGGLGNTPMPPVAPTAPGDRDLPAVPGPPAQTPAASRPSSWPGGSPSETLPSNSPQGFSPQRIPPVGAVPAVDLKPFDQARIVARVGTEAILESDLIVRGGPPNFEVIGSVAEFVEANKDGIPPDQLDMQREMLMKRTLQGIIQSKMIFLDAKRTIPAEGWAQVESQLTKIFEEEELERMMKRAGVGTRQELNQKLLALGTSLEREKRSFIERSLVQHWVRQQIKPDEQVTDQMISYYHSNLKEFTSPARAKWEELMVSYSKYPSKDEARDALAKMGNQVFTGAPFAEVAKAGSNGIMASDGGLRDWTSKGSLACKELDLALFGLPIGQLSPIIEGPTGFHIIRVTSREEEKVTPFSDAQVEIRKKILDNRAEKQYREYMAKVEEKTPVWTIFDGDASKAPNKESLSNRQQEPLR